MTLERFINGQDYHDEQVRERLERQAHQLNESDEQNREPKYKALDMKQYGIYKPTGRRRRRSRTS